ncbi:MAG: hypothetical protein AAFQ82_21000 [Myxococcota bacterium]
MPTNPSPELDPFRVPEDERESIEGKVALELIPKMRRATYVQERLGMRALKADGRRVMVGAWIVAAALLLGASAIMILRLL